MNPGQSTILPSGVVLMPIPSLKCGDYAAGSDGDIYSRKSWRSGSEHRDGGWRKMLGAKSRKGYMHVTISSGNVRLTCRVHRLVCEAFHGVHETADAQTRHLDGDSSNNRPENLAWGTREENWVDRKLHGRCAYGDRHPMVKLSNEDRDHIRWAIGKGICSTRLLSKALGVAQSTIRGVLAADRTNEQQVAE